MSQLHQSDAGNRRWTPERQLRFLDALAETRNATKAAAIAGMSRESAYRLRARSGEGLFTLLWDRALELQALPQGHTAVLSDGGLARLLGNHFRRESGDFLSAGMIRSGLVGQ